MNQQQIDDVLGKTLEDRKLSGSEKSALLQYLGDAKPDDATLNFIRNRAFAIAKSTVIDPDSTRVIDWLEDVVKLLLGRRWEAGSAKPDGTDEEAAAYFTPGDDCVAALRSQFRKTRKTCDICVFTITDNHVADAIHDAHRRGVKVRIVTDDEKSEDRGSDVEQLAEAGIPVRYDRSEYHMHHKFAVFDGARLLTGSYNWTRGAAMNNEENFLVTADPALVERFAGEFEKLWEKWA